MKIYESDYRDVLTYLVGQRWDGNEFVVFPHKPCAVDKDELFCFLTSYQAKEFCYEMSTDIDKYGMLGIRALYRCMSEAIQDAGLQIKSGRLIDLSAMLEARVQRMEEKEIIDNLNDKIMNQNNLEFLTDQVKYTGFGDDLANDLRQNIEKGGDDFKLNHTATYGEDTIKTTLNFSKSKETEMYFFNSYKAALQKEGSSEALEQTFYINKGSNITLKEAYNLMEGRAVNKDLTNKQGEKYNAWVQLDFKHSDENGTFRQKKFSDNYGYDLEAAVSKYPIKELQRDDFKDSLMDSLKKGNVQSVTFQVDGNEQKHYIEANPQFKTVNVYDQGMQRLGSRETKSVKQSEGESKSEKKSEKVDVPDGEVSGDSPKAKKKRGQKV